ncbi:helix-turn-helix domain-containing protein [Achromobacter pestifer]|uniref:Helix-turn-helix domain-containing protein n=1 Tax=Achromobacter pestifer TaxID=1353889 RepID=A0A7D4IJ19_9BURK|nr:helix-turn-helix domain-containing protein [Achromobacter pestifer]QKH36863.1 helix-turn-helix domain-containing protein [Achromobacter pestifer]
MENIRSVSRVLQLLRVLNEKPEASLQDLHAATGQPKATLHRMLETLRQEGYVRGTGVVGIYCLTAKVMELSAGCGDRQRVVDMAMPMLIRATKVLKWPLAISTLDVDAMVVRFSTMPYSPLASQPSTYGHRLPLDRTAAGLAYLSFCSEAERSAALQVLLKDAGGTESGLLLADAIDRTRRQGYGLRLAAGPRETATLAVPLMVADELAACVSLTSFGSIMTPAFIKSQLLPLREVCNDLAEAIQLG